MVQFIQLLDKISIPLKRYNYLIAHNQVKSNILKSMLRHKENLSTK